MPLHLGCQQCAISRLQIPLFGYGVEKEIARRQSNEAEDDTEDEQLSPNRLFEGGTNEDSNNKAVEEERQQCILALSKAEELVYLLKDEMEEQRNAFEDELRMKLTQKVN